MGIELPAHCEFDVGAQLGGCGAALGSAGLPGGRTAGRPSAPNASVALEDRLHVHGDPAPRHGARLRGPTFRPDPGDLVPCHHHRYCPVELTGGSPSDAAFATRASRRPHSELLDWLGGRSETTVHALLRQGFTLWMVAA